MSVPRFKRKPSSGLEYIDNAYSLQQEIMNLCSKLSARWVRIYQQPIDKLAFLQADFVNMSYSIVPKFVRNSLFSIITTFYGSTHFSGVKKLKIFTF